jgi:hypothetical protein
MPIQEPVAVDDVIGPSIYKGSSSGLVKDFFDILDHGQVDIALSATAGTTHHV